jgi:hypothetical protein
MYVLALHPAEKNKIILTGDRRIMLLYVPCFVRELHLVYKFIRSVFLIYLTPLLGEPCQIVSLISHFPYSRLIVYFDWKISAIEADRLLK